MKLKFSTVLFLFFCSQTFAAKPQIQQAQLYSSGINLDEFLVSEKFDGVRGYFDGEKFISRQGNVIKAPTWFSKNFPNQVLDGELWIGRGKFEQVSALIHAKTPDEASWRQVKFMVFDLPKSSEVFVKRYESLKTLAMQANSTHLQIIEQFEVKDHQTLKQLLKSTIARGGEGLMLHRKNSLYKAERNDDLLKLKAFEDAEGTVIAHLPGQGKFTGKLGAILVESELENGQKIRFKIGSGLSDKQRQTPPAIGSTITYKFFGRTQNNIPRFASFWRERVEE